MLIVCYVILPQVRHSQRLNESPLACWVILEPTSEVCCAHCTCKAGQGETCTHVASLLFYLEASARIQGTSATCTQEACQWIIPSYLKEVEYLPINSIDFTSARGIKRRLDSQIKSLVDSDVEEQPVESDACEKAKKSGSRSTETELQLLFQNLSVAGTKPGVLSVVPTHSEQFVPTFDDENFPQPLTSLKNVKYVEMKYDELLKECESVPLNVTEKMVKCVETATRDQSKSKLWYKFRAGHITASRMKAVCCANAAKPSQSLIKGICHPEAFSFTSKATKWGCSHENEAREIYTRTSKSQHSDFSVTDCGLFLSTQWPFVGASPDGIINCSCHGRGVLEIKCPFCHREASLQTATEDKKFCLKQSDGEIYLDRSHAYYYQVQTQLFACNVDYADFCVCTFEKDLQSTYSDNGIHIERIERNLNFWTNCIDKAHHFFRTSLLPELMGNWYSRPAVKRLASEEGNSDEATADCDVDCEISLMDTNNSPEPVYCYCRGPEDRTMIACDNSDCPIEWFHTKCLKMKSLPKGKSKWYCPDCRKLPEFLSTKKKL